MSESLERVRRVCLALPEAWEKEAWGAPTFRVRKRLFALFALFARAGRHRALARDDLWCAAPLGVQEIMVRSEPEKFFVPPYVGPRGWIGVHLDAVDDDELRAVAVQAYCLLAPKKLQKIVHE